MHFYLVLYTNIYFDMHAYFAKKKEEINLIINRLSFAQLAQFLRHHYHALGP